MKNEKKTVMNCSFVDRADLARGGTAVEVGKCLMHIYKRIKEIQQGVKSYFYLNQTKHSLNVLMSV